MKFKENFEMTRVPIHTTIDEELYFSVQTLALKLSQKERKRIPANELIEEGMRYILKKYENELK